VDPKKILIEDEHLIAVNKSAGELVVADRWGKETNILLHRVGEYLRLQGHEKDSSGRDLYPVHRLDRETSGVVLFAKNQDAHRELSKMFEARAMEKVYWAFCFGSPEWDYCKSEIPLTRAEGKRGRGRALVDLAKGKPAETEFYVRQRYQEKAAWIEAHPFTGRLHQIRVHLKALGHPLLYDSQYGFEGIDAEKTVGFKILRTPLHARRLSFVHPFSKAEVNIEAPIENDMRALVNLFLEKRSAAEPLD
jgi:RluA family pseudouridine synthase